MRYLEPHPADHPFCGPLSAGAGPTAQALPTRARGPMRDMACVSLGRRASRGTRERHLFSAGGGGNLNGWPEMGRTYRTFASKWAHARLSAIDYSSALCPLPLIKPRLTEFTLIRNSRRNQAPSMDYVCK
jgi:hypothetical protein